MQPSLLFTGDTLCDAVQLLARVCHPLLRFAGHIRLLRYLM